MGKKSAIQKSAKGDLIPIPGPLEQQIEGSRIAKARSEERAKRKRKVEQEAEEELKKLFVSGNAFLLTIVINFTILPSPSVHEGVILASWIEKYIPNTLSEKIISQAKKQLNDIETEDGTVEVEANKRMRNVSLGGINEDDSEGDDFPEEDDGYEDQALDPKDEADLERFMVNKDSGAKTLYDIIRAKIDAKTDDAELALSSVDPNEFNVRCPFSVSALILKIIRDLDPEVVEMYKEIGKKWKNTKGIQSHTKDGELGTNTLVSERSIFQNLLLMLHVSLTDPDGWSAAAMYQATRLFASNLNPRMCQ
ncbi:unnamed protein product, partial [Strongylus vulgaris]